MPDGGVSSSASAEMLSAGSKPASKRMFNSAKYCAKHHPASGLSGSSMVKSTHIVGSSTGLIAPFHSLSWHKARPTSSAAGCHQIHPHEHRTDSLSLGFCKAALQTAHNLIHIAFPLS